MKSILILLIATVLLSIFWYPVIKDVEVVTPIDTSDTSVLLESLNNQDLKAISNDIEAIEYQLMLDKMESRPLSQRFKNAVVVGDSMVEALSAYQVLPKKSVAGSIGKRADNIYEQVDIALKRKPKHLFLCLGLNDISSFRKYVNMFKDNYQALIDYIKDKDPQIKIYINSMIPLPKNTIKNHKEFKYIDEYNTALKQLCKENKLQYIDNTSLIDLKKNQFESDGIHPKYDYFKVWAKHMANEAMLF